MPGKPITEEGLAKDVEYTIRGTSVHALLYELCPPRRGLEVLEPGCGSGKLGMGYWLHGCYVQLCDIDEGVLAYTEALKARLINDLKDVIQGRFRPDPELLEIEEASVFRLETMYQKPFDLVFNEGVPHHFSKSDARRQLAIDQMASVTKPGGMVVVVGSNAHCAAMMEYAARIDHTYEGMPPKQEPFTQGELQHRLQHSGLIAVDCQPVDGGWNQSMLLAGWGRKP